MPYRENFPIPPDINPPRFCLCLEIPNTPEHKQVVAGLLWELTQWFNWQRDDANSGSQLAAVYRDVFKNIDWSDMSCCCNQTIPIMNRIDPENPVNLQTSYDGGITWITNPNQIYNNIVPLPLPTFDDHHTKCDAASNALQHIKDLVAEQETQMGTGNTIAEVALAIILFLIGIFLAAITEGFALPLVAEFVGVLAAIFSLGLADFTAYWTTDVYDKILCALFCNIEDDGSYTLGDFSAVLADLEANLPASPAKDWLIRCLNLGGVDGLNNLARYGASADADCSDCGCGGCTLESWTEINSNTITRPHPDEIQGDAYNIAGTYYFGIAAPTDSGNCKQFTVTVVSGAVSGTGSGTRNWSLCGEGLAASHNDSFFEPGSNCYRTLYYSSTVPFTLLFHCDGDCT